MVEADLKQSPWFTGTAGPLTVNLSYRVGPTGPVHLLAVTSLPGRENVVWRSYFVAREAAPRCAEDLVGQADEYLDQPNWVRRPTEDLDFDDFLTHLQLNLEGGFT